jgi:hypothetical protein
MDFVIPATAVSVSRRAVQGYLYRISVRLWIFVDKISPAQKSGRSFPLGVNSATNHFQIDLHTHSGLWHPYL